MHQQLGAEHVLLKKARHETYSSDIVHGQFVPQSYGGRNFAQICG